MVVVKSTFQRHSSLASNLDELLRLDNRTGHWLLAEHMLAGTAEECVAGIRAVADAGGELILLNPLVDDRRQLERLAGEVIPALT